MEIKTVELSEAVKSFLTTYKPESEFVTSLKEIRLVEDNLNIESHRHELRELRNAVVKFYNELLDDEWVTVDDDMYLKDPEKFYGFMNAMMSVTAVIDNYAYKF